MPCKCIEIIDEQLKERNTRLSLPLLFSVKGEPAKDQRVMIETEQLEKGRGKQKAVGMFPTFCPFCGVKHDAEPKPSVEAELLAALKDMLPPKLTWKKRDADGFLIHHQAAALNAARAAVAKAEGRS